MLTMTQVPVEVADKIDRLQTALLELECVARHLTLNQVTDQWEQNRLLNEIGQIVNNGRK